MFCFLFGWRKASKCKKLIKQALFRLEMLKNRRHSIATQLREDLLELLSNGYKQIAFKRVEQLVRDERLMEAYDLIKSFCEFILVKLSHIRKHKTCSDDIMEAISSLIFASARFGNFPELKLVRKLFEQRYGRCFAKAAVELCPGNLVNPRIKEKLEMKHVLDHEKLTLMSEISRNCFNPEVLALEYCPDWHKKQVVENGDQTNSEEKRELKVHDSNAEKLERVAMSVDSSPDSSIDIVDPNFQSYPSEREEVFSCSALASSDMFNFEDGLYRENDLPSPEFLPFFDETIVYLDDVVELPNPSTVDGHLLEQRYFKFKSNVTSMRENVRYDIDQSLIENQHGSKRKHISERPSPTCHKRENNSSSDTKKNCLSCHNLSSESLYYDYEVKVSENTKTDSYFIWSSVYNRFDNAFGQEVESDTDTFSRTERVKTCEIGTVVYDVFVYSHYQKEKLSTNHNHKSSIDFNEKQSNFTKSMKVGDKHPSHVHPKLPDYDEIEAKFMALKREYMQRKKNH